jgi:hypothetical protein
MTTVCVEIPRADLRALIKRLRERDVAAAVSDLASLFVGCDDIEAQTFGIYLDELEGLPDSEEC